MGTTDGLRPAPGEREIRETRKVMSLALAVGILLLVIKLGAYLLSNSTAILGDAVESVAHIFATAFAFFSLGLSQRPADNSHHYGHAKISFVSQAIEGGMISVAAVFIMVNSVMDFVRGPELESVGWGTALSALAGTINLIVGLCLLVVGKRHNSVVVQTHAKHVLTDVWTTAAVLLGLMMVLATGWQYFDPICALAISSVILKTGLGLVRGSFSGLLDEADPQTQSTLEQILDYEVAKLGGSYHQLRHRQLGDAWAVEYHLLLPGQITIEEAHRSACKIEKAICERLGERTEVITHLEAIESHDELHPPRV
jgi:cation diffusion facilitator family transporter